MLCLVNFYKMYSYILYGALPPPHPPPSSHPRDKVENNAFNLA